MAASFPNYFAYRPAAERYALGRPYLHPRIVERIPAVVGKDRFPLVLDVACGTGQSSRAISAYAERLVGLDYAREMLAQATPPPGIALVVARAEELPFAPGAFDLLTVGLGFHWFDQPRFLHEARRVLRPGAWLVIYNYAFLGEMPASPEFREWFQSEYLARFPNTRRGTSPPMDEAISPFGFTETQSERFTLSVDWRLEELAGFLLTQSNVIAGVERGGESLASATAWISRGAAPYFTEQPRSLPFQIDLYFLRAGA